jgi:molybdenum-dependent DNA-binding transcriptional regulator ModE
MLPVTAQQSKPWVRGAVGKSLRNQNLNHLQPQILHGTNFTIKLNSILTNWLSFVKELHMDRRQKLPLAALRAFEATARHGRFTAAAEELGVTHGAISKHVSQLEEHIGVPLFEGVRNRPQLTEEGRIFSAALTGAFDQIEDAVRMILKRDIDMLDVACLSTLAMRWLDPKASKI